MNAEIKIKECSLCEMEIVSDTGKGCLMCGMPIPDGEFCSMKCEEMYERIQSCEE